MFFLSAKSVIIISFGTKMYTIGVIMFPKEFGKFIVNEAKICLY